MKKHRRISLISLLCIAALLAVMFTGCSSSTSTSADEEESTETTDEENEEAEEASEEISEEETSDEGTETEETEEAGAEEDETVESASEEAGEATSEDEESTGEIAYVEVSLPISEETVTFSIWYPWPPVLTNFTEGPQASPAAQEMESRTNVTLDYHTVSTEAAETEFSLMVVSGSYTDLILGGTGYYNNPDTMIDDEVAIDIAPYLDEYMPNMKAILESNEEYALAAYTESGRIAECYKFEIGTDNNLGPVIRKDWLDELGLDVPETYDELYEALTAFKNELGVSSPLLIPYTGLTSYYSMGYGVPAEVDSLFFVVDGEVKYAGLEQDYYDFLTLMAQWYAEGLIDQDFLTRTTTTDPDTGLITSDNAGVWTANVLMFTEYANSADNPDFELVGMSFPKQTEDSAIMYQSMSDATGTGFVVTTACWDVETCLRYIDYWYSEEGSFLANYGIEGTSFEYDENGEPHLTELILESEMGLPSSLTSSIYVIGSGPFLEDCYRNQYFFGDAQNEAIETWDISDEEYCSEAYPSDAYLSVEESETYNAIMGDINTYMEEVVTSVLVGNSGTEALEEMEDNLISMNIEEAIELKQAAYDRYIAKAG